MSGTRNSGPFAARTIAIVIAVVLVAFTSFVLLTAYAGDLRPKRNGAAHALSTSGVGFAGMVELLRLTDRGGSVVRNEREMHEDGLLVLTPGPETSPEAVKAILDKREDLPTLIVLPKWVVRPLKTNPAWVEALAELPDSAAALPLKEVGSSVSVAAGRGGKDKRRTVSGTEIRNVVDDGEGGILLGAIGDSMHYVLADPDMLNNRGLATAKGAEQAIELLDVIATADEPIAFDVTLAGFGRNPNLLKLLIEPPFLPLTLCLVLAAMLAVLHSLWRFGPAAREERAFAFGKRAIAENGAALLRLARRRHRTGGRYVALTREAVAVATGAPPNLSGEALDRYLDRLNPEGEPFTSIAARATDAPDTRRLLQAVRELYQWRRTVTREHR